MTQTEEKVSALQEFQLYVREGDALYIKQNFKYVLCYLLTRLFYSPLLLRLRKLWLYVLVLQKAAQNVVR